MAKEQHGEQVRFGPFLFHPGTGELQRDGRVVSLRPLPTRALALFVRRPGTVLSQEVLRRELWGETIVEYSNGIHQVIRQVRQALGEHGHGYIETLPRRGYRFTACVRDAAPARLLRSPGVRLYAAGFATPVLLALAGIVLICLLLC